MIAEWNEKHPDYRIVQRRWFVGHDAYRRDWFLLPALEVTPITQNLLSLHPAESGLVFCEIQPHPEAYVQYPSNLLVGNEPGSIRHTADEAQELLDALWQAGLRPTRR